MYEDFSEKAGEVIIQKTADATTCICDNVAELILSDVGQAIHLGQITQVTISDDTFFVVGL